jgi:hypothetical protein
MISAASWGISKVGKYMRSKINATALTAICQHQLVSAETAFYKKTRTFTI